MLGKLLRQDWADPPSTKKLQFFIRLAESNFENKTSDDFRKFILYLQIKYFSGLMGIYY